MKTNLFHPLLARKKQVIAKLSRSYFQEYLLAAFLILSSVGVRGQVNITPQRNVANGFPTWTDINVTGGASYPQLLKAVSLMITPAMNFDAYTSKTLDFKARTYGGGNVIENTITISISVDDGMNWIVLGTRIPTTPTMVLQPQFDLSSYAGTKIKIQFSVGGTSDTIGVGIEAIEIKGIIIPSGFTVAYSGNVNTSGFVPTDDTNYLSGASVTVLGNTGALTKTGYTFSGWNTLANGAGIDRAIGSTFLMPAENTALYAKWTANNNNITFDKNALDATGDTSTQTIATAATGNLTANGYSRVGYTFAGWANTSGGSLAFTDGATYTMGTSNVTLYALWNSTSSFITTLGSLAPLSTTYGTASTNTSFTVSAGNLTGNLVITPPSGFEVSTLATSGFTTSLNLGSGIQTDIPIYVRLTTTTPVATYNGNINLISGATSTTKATVNSTVSVKELTITGLTGTNKIYDGNTTATLSGAATLNGVISPDDVTLSVSSSTTYATKDVGLGKVLTTAYTLTGAKAGNYSVTQPTELKGNITAKALNAAPTIASKVYDGSPTTGAITLGTISGFVGIETATATATGTYADANAGIGKTATVVYVLANGTNGSLATNYTLASETGTGNITKAALIFTTTAISLNVGGMQTIPTSISNSVGVLSFVSSNSAIATVGSATGVVSGVTIGSTTVLINQAESLNYDAGGTAVTVTVASIVFAEGDYWTINDGDWHGIATSGSINTWQQLISGVWTTISNSPPSNAVSLGTKKVYIRNAISLVGTNTAPNVVVLNEGILTTTIGSTFGNLLVKTNGVFNRQGNASGVRGIFEVEDNATVNFYHTNTTSRTTSIWAGVEKFHPNSNFYIKVTDNTSNFLVIQAKDDVSLFGDACFGNLIIDQENGKLQLLPAGFNRKLTHNNLIFRKGSDDIRFSNTTYSATIGGDLIVEPTFKKKVNLLSGSESATLEVNGDISINSTDGLNLNTGSGIMVLNLNGDIHLETGSKLTSNAVGSLLNFAGIDNNPSTHTIDIANLLTVQNIAFNVKDKATVELINQDLALGTNSSFTVNSGGTLDFGFKTDGTALNILGVISQQGQKFELKDGGTLKVTSPLGITSSGSTGNVEVPTRIYASGANTNYYYTGNTNQETGNGLPTTSISDTAPSRNVIVLMGDDLLTLKATGVQRFNSDATLFIQKGVVIDEPANNFANSGISVEKGNLKMSGGRYQLNTSGTQPDLKGNYDLIAGVVEFKNSATDQTIRNKSYQNIEITGTRVGNSSGNITLNSMGTFKVKKTGLMTGGIFSINNYTITCPSGNGAVYVEENAIFNTSNSRGFNGFSITYFPTTSSAINSDITDITLADGSTVEYSRVGNQIITAFKPLEENQSNLITGGYYNLKLSGNNGDLITGTAKTILSTTPVYVRNNIEVAPQTHLIIEADKALIVRNKVINNGGAANNFIVESDGNLKQITDDIALNNTFISVRRLFTWSDNERKEYNFLSSPVYNQNMKKVFGGNEAYVPFVTVLNESTSLFVNAKPTDYLVKGKGFSVKEPKTDYLDTPAESLVSNEAEYKGIPNTGTIILPLAYTNGGNRGYNIAGNPYPSNIDLVELYNKSYNKNDVDPDIDPTFRFWDNSINDIYKQLGGSYGGYSYALFNVKTDAGGYGTAAPGKLGGASAGSKQPNGIVKVSQAFIVRALKAAASLKFDNEMRRVANSNTVFYGKTSAKNRYRLQLVAPEGLIIQNAISYFAAGKKGLGIEDSKIPNSSASDALFCLVEDAKIVINGRPLFDVDDVIPLGTRHFKNGSYTIKAIDQEGVFANNQAIYLKDKELGLLTDISTAPYSFTSTAGEFTNRFEIVYVPQIVLATTDQSKSRIELYQDGQDFIIRSLKSKIIAFEIYDMSGRMITSQKSNSKEVRFAVEQFIEGTYLVKAKLQEGTNFLKKFRKY